MSVLFFLTRVTEPRLTVSMIMVIHSIEWRMRQDYFHIVSITIELRCRGHINECVTRRHVNINLTMTIFIEMVRLMMREKYHARRYGVRTLWFGPIVWFGFISSLSYVLEALSCLTSSRCSAPERVVVRRAQLYLQLSLFRWNTDNIEHTCRIYCSNLVRVYL